MKINRISFLLVSAIHFLATLVSAVCYFASSFAVFDSINPPDVAPLELQVINVVMNIFMAPASFFGDFSSLSPLWLYSIVFILNSFFVGYVIVLIYEKMFKN